jgi:hypothetical protein
MPDWLVIAPVGKRAKDCSAHVHIWASLRLRQAGEGCSKASVGGRSISWGRAGKPALAMPLLTLVSEPSPCRLREVSNYGCKSRGSGIS